MKTILLTGATDGIGRETAKSLAEEGHHLLLHGRNKEKLESLKKELLSTNPSLSLDLYTADLSDLNAVKSMAEDIAKAHKSLDVIINNAGVYVVPKEEVITKDNLDIRIAVNTVAPYLLTKKLLPLLSKESRVVNVASAAQMPLHFPALHNQAPLSHDEAYAQSKLAIIMWSMELAETETPIFISVNPKSFLGSKMVKVAYGREGFDLKIGADILCRAALSPEFATANGAYYCNDNQMFAQPHPFALNKENRTTLMNFLNKF